MRVGREMETMMAGVCGAKDVLAELELRERKAAQSRAGNGALDGHCEAGSELIF